MQNWLQLENKVIIVTGGETGIGKAIADKLSGLSANVISADIHTDSANKQDSIYHIYCDVSSKESVDAMVQKVIAASFKSTAQVQKLLVGGIESVTIGADLLERIVCNNEAVQAAHEFAEAWNAAYGTYDLL